MHIEREKEKEKEREKEREVHTTKYIDKMIYKEDTKR